MKMKEMTEEQRKEFKKLANKMAKFINDNFDPYHIVVIENDRADIYSDRCGYPMKGKVIYWIELDYA